MQAIKNSTVYRSSLPRTAQSTAQRSGNNGALRNGVEWANPRFTDNNDGTVTDNLTGLIWLKNANCTDMLGEVSRGLNTWTNALAFTNKLANGHCGLSDGSRAGDWRLPNESEFRSLMEYRKSDSALRNPARRAAWREGVPFTNLRSTYYWATTTVSGNPSRGWMVYLNVGNMHNNDEANNLSVWPVRGGR